MKKLLSLPPGLVDSFHEVAQLPRDEYFVGCDPVGRKLGSGGGTIHLLELAAGGEDFETWLAREPRVMIHAGGQSRRLPAYAPVGKILTPIPVFRWARGQRIDQTLLSLQLPLYERICELAGSRQHTLVCSGDVLNVTEKPLPHFDTNADVVCFAIGAEATVAQNHGVFLSRRDCPSRLDYMLQKPTPQRLAELAATHFFLIDIGVWLLSDKAVMRLRKKCQERGTYDLYSEFGQALGAHPSLPDPDLADLTIAIAPLDKGEFYHFGTTHDLIQSTIRLQNKVTDGRDILHLGVKPHPSIFIQNSIIPQTLKPENEFTWIENSRLGDGFTLTNHNVVTGVPDASLRARLEPGQCLDIVPIGERSYAVRSYMFDDKMSGDRQFAPLYGIAESASDIQTVLDGAPCRRISADEISNTANLQRLAEQRRELCRLNLVTLQANHERSVFYQLDLHHAASMMQGVKLKEIGANAPIEKRMAHAMLTDCLKRECGRQTGDGERESGRQTGDGEEESLRQTGDGERESGRQPDAFELLRESLTGDTLSAQTTRRELGVAHDQIVWARCPVRIDLAGGWTDTPPYCLTHGGDVINIAIDLNGQQPLQVYARPCEERHIIVRSIDLGVSETITTSESLRSYAKVGSAFSIPKAALALAGFGQGDLAAELNELGCGIELTLLSAIPSGSGLGTSSILAATTLAAVSDFLKLGWDKNELCRRTLILEQMLTTGGGWQDQCGGVMAGVKRLTTTPGLEQAPDVRWLPDTLFTQPDYQPLHLLYYTGVRRTAKHILDEIVRGMFLQRTEHLQTLADMRENVSLMHDAIGRGQLGEYGRCLRRTWTLNKRLDAGTNPPIVDSLTSMIDDLCLGYKLPGAGGGGYLYMLAKDSEAALRIRKTLTENRPNDRARFVEMTISRTGLQVTRS